MTTHKPDADLLTAEERAAITAWRNSNAAKTMLGGGIPMLLDALDRLAPAPQPPAPRVGELAAQWRSIGVSSGATEQMCCAYGVAASELDAAMERWRERMRGEFRNAAADQLKSQLDADTLVRMLLSEEFAP